MRLKFFTLFLVLFVFETKALFAGEVRFISNKVDVGVFGKEATKTLFEGDVYDLSFVAYDKDFAEEFGLKQELITSMDKGLRFMEVKMITEGKQTNCHYNLVLDKSVEVAFPKGRNYNPHQYPIINYPTPSFTLSDPNLEKIKAANARLFELRIQREKNSNNSKKMELFPYNNRLYIGTQDYQKDKPSSQNSAFVNYYIQDRLNYKIISMRSLACEYDALTFSTFNPSIWIANDNTINYNAKINPSKDYFFRPLIPSSISKQISPILLEFRKNAREVRNKKYESKS